MIRNHHTPRPHGPRSGNVRLPAPAAPAALLLMALLAFGGCSSSSASAGPTTPVSPSAVATPTDSPPPSFLTSGYSAPEDAVRAWVEGRGDVYVGDCLSGAGEAGEVCSIAEGEGIYSVGLVMSEPGWLLHLKQVGDLWYVAEVTVPPSPA